jgi:glutamate 5-kinase
VVDDGARRALVCEGKSLLPIGIKSVEGTFEPGALVNIKDTSGVVVARGLTDYSSAQILRIKGHPTRDISAILGAADFNDVVHRDNLAVLAK